MVFPERSINAKLLTGHRHQLRYLPLPVSLFLTLCLPYSLFLPFLSSSFLILSLSLTFSPYSSLISLSPSLPIPLFLPLYLSFFSSLSHVLLCDIKNRSPQTEKSWLAFTGNTKGESITVPLTSCLTILESAVCQLTIFVFICKTD